MNTSDRFAADTRKLAYAQAFSRTSAPHAPARSGHAPVGAAHAPLRTLTSRLHRTQRPAR